MSPPPVVDSTKEDKKSSQRRINKPLIEKRRRARINDCLAQLKTIVLEAQESQSPRPSKLEKADILEMTVEFIKKRTTSSANVSDSRSDDAENQRNGYTAGYAGCLAEVSKFLTQTDDINQEIKDAIIKHMAEKIRDSNNNVNTVNEKTSKPTEKVPIPSVPSKSRTITDSGSPPTAVDMDEKIDSNVSVRETFLTRNTIPPDISSFQNQAATLFPGSQVMVLLQLPAAQNMWFPAPLTAPFNMNQNPHMSIPFLNVTSTNEAVDLSKPQSPSIAQALNPHPPTRQTVDDPAAILDPSLNYCDKSLLNVQGVQTKPLNLCTTSKLRGPCSDDDPWRPW